VLLIRWHLDDDTFDFGQWLKGRVYERRCDLSREGDLLLYFAANYRELISHGPRSVDRLTLRHLRFGRREMVGAEVAPIEASKPTSPGLRNRQLAGSR
jgi:hypothetical protein